MFNLSAFISYIIVMVFSPGPNNFICLNNGIKYGFRKSLPYMFGVVTGFFSLLLASSFLNYYINRYLPSVKGFIQILGALFLLYLALLIIDIDIFKMMGLKRRSKSDAIVLNTTHFTTGLTMQFVNIKAILFSLTVVANFIAPYFKMWYQLLFFCILLSFITFLSLSAWATFGTLFKRFLSKYKKYVNYIMALMLIYSALIILGILN